jgi:hypothetical protein
MSLSTDILRSYRAPRLVVREQLGAGRREDRVLVYLMLACVLIFVAQWPGVTRAAQLDPSVPLQARLGGVLMAVLFVLPLIAYALAFLIWLALRLVGPVSAYGVRLALFWAVLAITPLMLAQAALSTALTGKAAQCNSSASSCSQASCSSSLVGSEPCLKPAAPRRREATCQKPVTSGVPGAPDPCRT